MSKSEVKEKTVDVSMTTKPASILSAETNPLTRGTYEFRGNPDARQTADLLLSGKLSSLPRSLFISAVNPDFLCTACQKVPLTSKTVTCCGMVYCKPCLEETLVSSPNKCQNNPDCSNSDTLREFTSSPYVDSQITALTVKCLYSVLDEYGESCSWKDTIGKDRRRLIEHLEKCPFHAVKCEDCELVVARKNMTIHRGEMTMIEDDCKKILQERRQTTQCQWKTIQCKPCGKSIFKRDWDVHCKDSEHLLSSLANVSTLPSELEKLKTELSTAIVSVATARSENESLKSQLRVLAREFDEKLIAVETRSELRIAELTAQVTAEFIEFTVHKWSTIALTAPSLGLPPSAAMYSAGTPLKVWGHEWWVKVEKTSTRIGLYLCCGGDGDPPPVGSTVPISRRWPIAVDYQLMVRKRGSDEGVCASDVFRTEFGREKAWGLSNFSTIEQIEKEGAWSRAEDIITFGCLIYPIRNLRWGRAIRRRASAASGDNR